MVDFCFLGFKSNEFTGTESILWITPDGSGFPVKAGPVETIDDGQWGG